jgi:hypothetical protein
MTSEDDLTTLKKQRDDLERQRAEATVRLEKETQGLRNALAELKDTYGVANLAEANSLLERLDQEFKSALVAAAEELKAAGA